MSSTKIQINNVLTGVLTFYIKIKQANIMTVTEDGYN